MRSRRLEVMGTRENKAREEDTQEERCLPRVPVFSCAHYFQGPATHANSPSRDLSHRLQMLQ